MRTTFIPEDADTRIISGMAARDLLRNMTSTFAPTKRNGLPSTTKRTPLARTNPRRAEPVPPRQLENANTIAATASKADAATNNRLLMKFGTHASWRAARPRRAYLNSSYRGLVSRTNPIIAQMAPTTTKTFKNAPATSTESKSFCCAPRIATNPTMTQ